MDYGYQLLRHVIAQVFGNLGAAARITVIPILLAYAICGVILYSIVGAFLFEMASQGPILPGQPQPIPFSSEAEAATFAGRFFLAILLCLPIFLVFYAWAAVGWHRYVLLEELPSGVTARWSWPIIKGYVGAVLRLILMSLLIAFAAAIVIGILLSVIPSPGLAVFLQVGTTIGFTWIFTRLGLVLPSAALGIYMKMGDSWSATAPVSSAILLPIIVIPLAFFLLSAASGLLGIIGLVLTLVLIWIQLLVNLALMTTLYGNLIEGRQLN
ncbi:hypothetical protein [Jannaschia sp. CCS1]|uniref:hypothetical protein n=1 Tax=Jannaschia sp. (strain CCS1) TaxID=290400 RepID=UPI000053B80A|nr:hypothetical protein [Jannaschia sp. CCS1]ABD52985.1 hypothetical protein Jann_0068 [Jannaschia sp. CCS1]